MSNISNTFDKTIDASTSPKNGSSWLKHGGYSLFIFIWEYFNGPQRPKQPKNKDNQFKFIAERLISTLTENIDQLTVDTTKQLLDQHRTIENTQARRRLERWACNAIIIYLVCVFLLLIFNGAARVIWPQIFTSEKPLFSDSVLYVILSTTTVNILGLGFIVLKGHFTHENKEKNENP